MAEQLELAAHGVTAILATWLGLVVLTRARQQEGARVFTLLCGYLVLWSLAIIVQRLSDDPQVDRVFRALEDTGAFLLPAGTLHIALTFVEEGRRTVSKRLALTAAYLACGFMAALAVVSPSDKFDVTPPHFELPGVPGEVFGWAWIGARILIFGVAVFWLARALPSAGSDVARRRQLSAALATVFVGATGGVMRIVPGVADSDPWIGVSLVSIAVVLAAYAVFAQGIFLAPDVASQAFWYSIVVGLGVTVYVGLLLGLEQLSRLALHVEVPIVTALALVVTIALFDPVSNWARRTIRARSPRQRSYDLLLRALGQDILTAQRPERAVQPALARLVRVFKLTGARVFETDGATVLAEAGPASADDPLALALPMRHEDTLVGTAVYGAKRSGLPFTPRESELLGAAASFLAASLHLAARHEVEAEALETLSEEHRAVETRGTALRKALRSAAEPAAGLHVYALGPLRVERDGQPVRHWGGAKAGTRQAEAVFAFLFDRGERGVAKDEMIELIWPDVDLERADLAFHRTLGGLRTTLEPGRRGGDRGTAITFHNDRYRLDTELIGWSDVEAFEEEMAAASAAADSDAALQRLERARSLIRGDFLDDCPFYGDSAQVEERRDLLRGRHIDLLMALGDRYEARGDRPAAAASFRRARQVAGDVHPPAEEALNRLGATL